MSRGWRCDCFHCHPCCGWRCNLFYCHHVYCHLACVVAGVARAQRAASLCEPKTLSIQRSLCSLKSTDSDTTKLAVSAVYLLKLAALYVWKLFLLSKSNCSFTPSSLPRRNSKHSVDHNHHCLDWNRIHINCLLARIPICLARKLVSYRIVHTSRRFRPSRRIRWGP